MNEKIQRKEKTLTISEKTNTYQIIQSKNNEDESLLLAITNDLAQSEQEDERLTAQLQDDINIKTAQLKQTLVDQLALHKENVRLNKFLELGESYRLDLAKSVHDTRSSIQRVISDIHNLKSSPVLPLLKDQVEAANILSNVQARMFEKLEAEIKAKASKLVNEMNEEFKMMKFKNENELGQLRNAVEKAMEENVKLRAEAVHGEEMKTELQEKQFNLSKIKESVAEIEAKQAEELEKKQILTQRIKDFENKINEGNNKLIELENHKDMQSKRRLELAENTVRLENDNKRMKTDIAHNKQLLLELDEQLKHLIEDQKHKLIELDATINGFENVLDQENKVVLKLHQTMENKTDEEKSLNKTLHASEKEMTTIINKRQHLLSITQNLETEHMNLISKITDLSLQCKEASEKINKITIETSSLHNTFIEEETSLNSEIEAVAKTYEEETATQKTMVANIIKEQKIQMEQIKEFHDISMTELQTSILALNNDAKQKAAEKKILETELNSVASECNIIAGKNTKKNEVSKQPIYKKIYSLEEVLKRKKKQMGRKY